jgi:UDP-N-acetylmuramate: L-alanyl-gamma-D-glutamyl-meso-diaminopimelate ligase
MNTPGKTIAPKEVYQHSVDKQRVVIAGRQASLITELTLHALRLYNREFDFVAQDSGVSPTWTLAPVLIVQENGSFTPDVLDYDHHIGVISDLAPSDAQVLSQFADQTHKGGVLIYATTDPVQAICRKERADVSEIPFNEYPYTIDRGQVILISSTNEKFPIHLSSSEELRCVSAAKEVLKKIGIASGQFYRAMSRFEK